MNSERIKEIQEQTAYPESVSVMLALKQVWNECGQEQLAIQRVSQQRELLIDFVSYLENKAGEYIYLLPTEQAIDDYLKGNL